MLALFVCQCANAELNARRVLRDAKVEDYLGVRCYTGRNSGNIGLANMPANIKETTDWKGLKAAIDEKPSYAIVAGWDADKMRWSDVYDGKLESVVPGELIAEHFAK